MAEEDIELTENEIGATRLALMVFVGLLSDLRDDEPEGVASWEETCKEQVSLDSDCNLGELLMSALRKFKEEETDSGEQNPVDQVLGLP